jgi:shikimate dehydrogenase
MPLLGLIGTPLGHSKSPELFADIFRQENLVDWEYRLFPLSHINELTKLIENQPTLLGLNVTIPYKTDILPLLDYIAPDALELGAVNTISIRRQDDKIKLIGYNTDTYGFEALLISAKAEKTEKALVLGSGGAAKAVCHVLKKRGIRYTVVSRNPNKYHISYADIDYEILRSHLLVINTTPLGMHPNTESFPPIPFQYISSSHIVIDLVYNPESTLFMEKATNYGAKAFNGMIMLHKQAEKAWNIFKQEN